MAQSLQFEHYADIVAVTAGSTDNIQVVSKTDESNVILTNPKGGNDSEYDRKELAVDNNNVYIVTCHKKRAENGEDLKCYVLDVFE